MDYTTFGLSKSKNINEEEFQELLYEKKIRQDLEELTVEDFILGMLDTIDKDTTVDMVEQNLLSAITQIQQYKTDRIKEILFLKHSWDFIRDKKQVSKKVTHRSVWRKWKQEMI